MSPYIKRLPAREVAEALGLRQFLKLCFMFDGRKLEKEGKALFHRGEYARFDVLRIAEVEGVLHVHCEDEYGQVIDVTVKQ